MGDNTSIEWADHTFNPWTGCTKVSAGCRNCYAEKWRARFGHGDEWGPRGWRVKTSPANWRNPLKWDRAAKAAGRPATVFCASLADVFEDRDELEPWREELFELIAATPHLIWLLLTKRPENILRLLPGDWLNAQLPNVWFGTSVENQDVVQRASWLDIDDRWGGFFLSMEPLLGPVDLDLEAIYWVIAGGESGPGARPMDPEWARQIRDQCAAEGVPFLFKQWGEFDELGRKVGKKAAGRILDGRTHDGFPVGFGRFGRWAGPTKAGLSKLSARPLLANETPVRLTSSLTS